MLRLFIAFEIPDDIKDTIDTQIIKVLRKTHARVGWVKRDNLHITLKFLGDTDESRIDFISKAIDAIAAEYSSVPTAIGSVGTFGGRNPRVVWVKPEGGEDQLGTIASQVNAQLAGFGFEPDTRAFKPHITIGRVRYPEETAELLDMIDNITVDREVFTVDRIVLMKSTLTPKGAEYNIIHDALLRPEATVNQKASGNV